ncbi:MAG: copper resistance protein B, partial [bacterium]
MTSHRTLLVAALSLAAALAATPAAAHMGEEVRAMLLVEELEYGFYGEDDPVAWDVGGWIGGDWSRLRLRSEGELSTRTGGLDIEGQLVYSRLVSAWWELRVGAQAEVVADDDARGRVSLVVGLEGVLPYWIEFEPQLFVSHEGDVSARVELGHALYLTQRLIAESSVELDGAVQSVPRFGVGAGFGGVELGLR